MSGHPWGDEPLLSWDELLMRDAPLVGREPSIGEIASGTITSGPHTAYALPRLVSPPSGGTLLLTVSLYRHSSLPVVATATGLGLSWVSMSSEDSGRVWLGSWRATGMVSWTSLAQPVTITTDRSCSKMAYRLVEIET